MLIRNAITTFVACAGLALSLSASAEAAKQGGHLVYATGTDAQTLDPQFVTDVPTSRVVMHIHETLVTRDKAGELKPALAESWSLSDDKLTWTFKLRRNVTFHDGTPFNAQAVKFTFDRLADPATGSPRKSSVQAIAETRVIDDHTVALVTKEPFAPLLAQLSGYNLAIISPSQVGKVGGKYREAPAGTGPLKLKSWQRGERVVLAHHEDYWGEKANLDTLEFRVVPEDSARTLLLMSGEADVIASVPTVMLRRLAATPDINLIKETGYRTIFVGLNNRLAPFDDVRVRRAVAMAINAEALLAGVLNGVGTLGGGMESPVIGGAHKGLKRLPYDPGKARELLAAAGHPNGFTTKFYVPVGRYLQDRQLGEAIQAQLAEVGIRAEIESPDWGTYVGLLDQRDKVPMFLLGKGSPTGDLDFTLTLNVNSTGMMNHYNFSDPAADALIKEQRGIIDPAKRAEVLAEAQELFHEGVAAIPLFYEEQLFAKRANVHDVEVLPNEFVDLRHAWKD